MLDVRASAWGKEGGLYAKQGIAKLCSDINCQPPFNA